MRKNRTIKLGVGATLVVLAGLMGGCSAVGSSSGGGSSQAQAHPAPETEYSLTVTVVGAGHVDPSAGSFPAGEAVTLMVTAEDGYGFDHWEGDVPPENAQDSPLAITLDADKAITAVFAETATDPGVAVGDIQKATWLVLVGTDDALTFTATAFGVRPKLLATNAHVAEGIREAFVRPGAVAFVVQHETGIIRSVTRVWQHPDYDGDSIADTPDVGLLEVDGDLSDVLPLAEDPGLQELAVFDSVSLCGFPGDVALQIDMQGITTGDAAATSNLHPRVTCLTGTISALRPLDPGVTATPQNTQLLQYDLPVAPGTSGSAVFDAEGKVIAVNAAGFTGQGDFNFGMRIDLLQELLADVDSGTDPGTDLSKIESDRSPGTPLCQDTCRFAGDGECDDGGPGSVFSVCDYGTDCLDCGDRGQADDGPDDAPDDDPSDVPPDPDDAIVPGASLGPINLGDSFAAVEAVWGYPDSVYPSQFSWTVFVQYDAPGIHVVLVDADRDEEPDSFEIVDGLFGWPPFAGTYQGIGLGSLESEVLSVMGPAEETMSDGRHWYWSRGILWSCSGGTVQHVYVFEPILSTNASTHPLTASDSETDALKAQHRRAALEISEQPRK